MSKAVILNDIVKRNSINSTCCKVLCGILTSATVLAGDHISTIIVIGAMFFLDGYYTTLEKCYIRNYSEDVTKIRANQFTAKGLFRSLVSIPIAVFYIPLAVCVLV